MANYTRKLGRTGGYSYFINLPKKIVQKYGWREKQKLSVTDKGRGLIELRDWKRR